jgi:outer membrane protein OmpA-like peptidoglycan-associated protein
MSVVLQWCIGLGIGLIGSFVLPVAAQQAVEGESTAAAERESLAASYPEGTTAKVIFKGTDRLPLAEGQANVRRRRGTTEIEVRLERLKPALLFGGDFSTYVLWTVSPEGVAVNTGEFIQRGQKSRLEATTPLSTFGMFVTAEPHFLVGHPSSFVVLENTSASLLRGDTMQTSQVKYRGFAGRYNSTLESLAGEEFAEGDFRMERQQATTALNLAERVGAERWAPEELARARQGVLDALKAYGPDMNEKQFEVLARTAIRLASETHRIALQNKAQAEEEAQLEELASLRVAKAEAEAAAAKASAEAARARRDRQQALEAKAEAEEAARLAQIQQRRAREMMQRAQAESEKLAALKAEAERYANDARSRLEGALSKVVETKETARGVIVNLPDILFASGRSTLRSKAREVLSRVAGILLVTPEIQLSIEGHTDSTGGENLNQQISEKRAISVANYLAESGVSPDIMSTAGFGETQPIVDNNSAAGRQQNRRVEIVIARTGEDGPFGR